MGEKTDQFLSIPQKAAERPLATAVVALVLSLTGAGGFAYKAESNSSVLAEQVHENTEELARREKDVEKIDAIDRAVVGLAKDVEHLTVGQKEILRLLRNLGTQGIQ